MARKQRPGPPRDSGESQYSSDLARFVCNCIAAGMTLEQISNRYRDDVPPVGTIRRWLWDENLEFHKEFKLLYGAARGVFRDHIDSSARKPYRAYVKKRPEEFDEYIANEIVERVANGETLFEIVKDENLPSFSTIHRWLEAESEPWQPAFKNEYERALRVHANYVAEQLMPRAREGAKSTELESIKWLAERRLPEKYSVSKVIIQNANAILPPHKPDEPAKPDLMTLIRNDPNLAEAAIRLGRALNSEDQKSRNNNQSRRPAKKEDIGDDGDLDE